MTFRLERRLKLCLYNRQLLEGIRYLGGNVGGEKLVVERSANRPMKCDHLVPSLRPG